MKKTTTLIALLISLQMFAYDAMGHRIIADIAYHELTASARRQCDKLLGKQGIVYASTWADEVRSDSVYKYSYQWHYQNLKQNLTREDFSSLFAHNTSEGEHLFYAIETLTNRLKKDKNDAEALKFLVHFIGDLHQPMHLGHADDLGGNRVQVKWFGKPTNLHAVWDGMITEGKKMSYTEYCDYLENSFVQQKKQIKSETMQESAWKVYETTEKIYKYGFDDRNNYKYIYDFSAINDEMMYRAGIQLAKLLNSLF